MGKLFGTDGVRGIPGKHPLLPDVIRNIALTATRLCLKQRGAPLNGRAPAVLLGRDTRGSGPELAQSLMQGFHLAGCRTIDLGVIPTPALSYLTPRLGAVCGVMVSASHNPAQFNGIKFFTSEGFKMDEATEDETERRLKSHPLVKAAASKPAREDGKAAVASYVDFLKSTFPATLDLSGFKLVVDCGHGSASAFAPALFESLGATVYPIGAKPNGRNINQDCGALFTKKMQAEVVRRKAHAGVSFDGDADRAIFSDERGRLIDGDVIICLAAVRLQDLGLLRGSKVALTVMSNFGLLTFLRERGVGVVTVPVGDRNVTDAIEHEGLSLGGEASGHIIFRSFAATGDGMLTALQTLAALREAGKPLSYFRGLYRPTPQIIKNVEVHEKAPLQGLRQFQAALKRHEKALGQNGRILVRYSGTEPLLRVMVEGPREDVCRKMSEQLVTAYRADTK
jgi:phosphoglucosamine mutase